jgi:uncharacterized protein (TIGR03000 family)
MFLSTSIRLGSAIAVALAAQTAFAAPPPHAGGARPAPGPAHVGAPHMGAPHVGAPGGVRTVPVPVYRPAPYYGGYGYGYRSGVSVGIGIGSGYGYGSGLYGPLGYGLGYSPFGYSGLPYGGVGYGALGYGYGYPSTRTIGLGLPATTGISVPYEYIPPQSPAPWSTEPMPLPLPVPENGGKGEPATITVITSEGATVMFNDISSEQTGTRHSFTTKPIAPGVQSRVLVKVGSSSVSIGVRSGEKATVDMRN